MSLRGCAPILLALLNVGSAITNADADVDVVDHRHPVTDLMLPPPKLRVTEAAEIC